jgi:hypothetical protein
MPRVLTEAQVRAYERDGYLFPIRAMSAERARHYREKFEALEARVPDIKKMKTKSHLLCPWVLEIAEDPHILDVFEDLIGPNLRCWSMAWRVKKADRETFAGWHQDLGLRRCAAGGAGGARAVGVRGDAGLPARHSGSHKGGILTHGESADPKSILARGQHITDRFDEDRALDFPLQPGEMVLFDNSLIHSSGVNAGPDRRFLLLVEMHPTWARPPRTRQSTMLVRGVDTYGNFDDEPRPDAEWSPTALANWARITEKRANLIFEDSVIGPSEAYGGKRPAT